MWCKPGPLLARYLATPLMSSWGINTSTRVSGRGHAQEVDARVLRLEEVAVPQLGAALVDRQPQLVDEHLAGLVERVGHDSDVVDLVEHGSPFVAGLAPKSRAPAVQGAAGA